MTISLSPKSQVYFKEEVFCFFKVFFWSWTDEGVFWISSFSFQKLIDHGHSLRFTLPIQVTHIFVERYCSYNTQIYLVFPVTVQSSLVEFRDQDLNLERLGSMRSISRRPGFLPTPCALGRLSVPRGFEPLRASNIMSPVPLGVH